MDKKATLRQIVYLNYLLQNTGKVLSDISSKDYEELTHSDIKTLYYQLNVPLSIDLRNFEYIIIEETDHYFFFCSFIKLMSNYIMVSFFYYNIFKIS